MIVLFIRRKVCMTSLEVMKRSISYTSTSGVTERASRLRSGTAFKIIWKE